MYRLFVDSNTGVTLYPNWDFQQTGEKIEDRHRARGGREYVYKWGHFDGFKFGVSFVDSATMAVVNSWWQSNTDLLFMSSGDTVVHSVHLVGKNPPIGKYVEPYDSLFSGTIELGTY